MILKCKTNLEKDVPAQLQERALTQSEGLLAVTPGKTYPAFAIKYDELGTWYFIQVDQFGGGWLWWMPEAIFEVVDDSRPGGWLEWNDHGNKMLSYSSLGDEKTLNEDILDYKPEALDMYLDQAYADPTFPKS